MSASAVHLLVASIVYGILGVCSVVPAAFSVMMFDAPGSEKNPATRLLFWSIVTFPGACLLAILAAWATYVARDDAAANLLVHVPLVNVVLFIVGFYWLKIIYGGRFNG
jgi:hypothetical protein